MFFASDNSGPVHPQIMEALTRVNDGHMMGYGRDGDSVTAAAIAAIRETFEAPEAEVWFVGTGTSANVLSLSSMTTSFQTVYCSRVAHIHEDECNGYEFYSGGGKLMLVGEAGMEADKMTPEALTSVIAYDKHRKQEPVQFGALSITQATERGRIYSLREINALSAVARGYNLPVHMDGARFANAVAALGCSPAEMTWKSGIDTLSFGGTKNGCMGVEAVIFFQPDLARLFGLRRQRAGHTFSKHRYLAAQMLAYLQDDLWLQNARAANEKRARLEAGLRRSNSLTIAGGAEANMLFLRVPDALHQKFQDAGAVYYFSEPDQDGLRDVRLVCDWSIPVEAIDSLIRVASGG